MAFAPSGLTQLRLATHGLRRGLYSYPASRLRELACFEFFQHAGHCTGSDPGTGGQVGDTRALLCNQCTKNGALALTQTVTADFVGTNLSEDSGQALQFVPPLLDLDLVCSLRWHKRKNRSI